MPKNKMAALHKLVDAWGCRECSLNIHFKSVFLSLAMLGVSK